MTAGASRYPRPRNARTTRRAKNRLTDTNRNERIQTEITHMRETMKAGYRNVDDHHQHDRHRAGPQRARGLRRASRAGLCVVQTGEREERQPQRDERGGQREVRVDGADHLGRDGDLQVEPDPVGQPERRAERGRVAEQQPDEQHEPLRLERVAAHLGAGGGLPGVPGAGAAGGDRRVGAAEFRPIEFPGQMRALPDRAEVGAHVVARFSEEARAGTKNWSRSRTMASAANGISTASTGSR